MQVLLSKTRYHAGFYTKVFALADERGSVVLRRRHYFPSGNYLTDPDIPSTGTYLTKEVEDLLG